MMFTGQYCVPDTIYKKRYTIYKYSLYIKKNSDNIIDPWYKACKESRVR